MTQNPNGDAKTPGLTVGDLLRALEGLDDDMSVVVRFENEGGTDVCGGILCAGLERGCGDGPWHFAIDCTDDEEAFDE